MDAREIYEFWLTDSYFDEKTKEELRGIAEDEKEEKILANQQILKTPIVRNGKLATAGYQPDEWRCWN